MRLAAIVLAMMVSTGPRQARAQSLMVASERTHTAVVTYAMGGAGTDGYGQATVHVDYRFYTCNGGILLTWALDPQSLNTSATYWFGGRGASPTAEPTVTSVRFTGPVVGVGSRTIGAVDRIAGPGDIDVDCSNSGVQYTTVAQLADHVTDPGNALEVRRFLNTLQVRVRPLATTLRHPGHERSVAASATRTAPASSGAQTSSATPGRQEPGRPSEPVPNAQPVLGTSLPPGEDGLRAVGGLLGQLARERREEREKQERAQAAARQAQAAARAEHLRAAARATASLADCRSVTGDWFNGWWSGFSLELTEHANGAFTFDGQAFDARHTCRVDGNRPATAARFTIRQEVRSATVELRAWDGASAEAVIERVGGGAIARLSNQSTSFSEPPAKVEGVRLVPGEYVAIIANRTPGENGRYKLTITAVAMTASGRRIREPEQIVACAEVASTPDTIALGETRSLKTQHGACYLGTGEGRVLLAVPERQRIEVQVTPGNRTHSGMWGLRTRTLGIAGKVFEAGKSTTWKGTVPAGYYELTVSVQDAGGIAPVGSPYVVTLKGSRPRQPMPASVLEVGSIPGSAARVTRVNLALVGANGAIAGAVAGPSPFIVPAADAEVVPELEVTGPASGPGIASAREVTCTIYRGRNAEYSFAGRPLATSKGTIGPLTGAGPTAFRLEPMGPPLNQSGNHGWSGSYILLCTTPDGEDASRIIVREEIEVARATRPATATANAGAPRTAPAARSLTPGSPAALARADSLFSGISPSLARGVYDGTLPALREAAQLGNSFAQDWLGYLHQFQLGGVALDYREARRWNELAANQGRTPAQRNLAQLYELGLGVPANRELAIKWYRRAAASGDQYARDRLVALGVAP